MSEAVVIAGVVLIFIGATLQALATFLDCLRKQVQKEREERENVKSDNPG